MQHRGGDDREDTVGLEQAPDNARFDAGLRAEDDDQISHEV
jgi:hypothetical protein